MAEEVTLPPFNLVATFDSVDKARAAVDELKDADIDEGSITIDERAWSRSLRRLSGLRTPRATLHRRITRNGARG